MEACRVIHLRSELLPEEQSKAVKNWLRQPECRIFTSWLASQAAALTAEAGNKLMDGEPSDIEDAKNIATKGRRYLGAFEIMEEVIPNDFSFQVTVFKPKPLTKE